MLLHHLQLVRYQWTSPDVTPGGDHVARIDAEQVEDIDENVELFAAIGTKAKPCTWVKKHESQACDRNKLKLKAVFSMTVVRRFI